MAKTRKSKQQRLPESKRPPSFIKKKEKAGKKKPRPTNETRTSFRARAISVPRQRALELAAAASTTAPAAAAAAETTAVVAAAAAEPPATRRKFSLDELLPRLSHSAEATRMEALSGLRELSSAHPDTLRMNAGPVLERVAQMVADADRVVRAHVRTTLAKVLGALGLAAAAPFMPLVVAYVCSGMTHPLEPVRADSVELASTLLVQYPPLSRRFARRILSKFGGIIASPKTMQQAYQRQHPPAYGTDMHKQLRLQQAQTTNLPVSSFKTRASALSSLLQFLRDLTAPENDAEEAPKETAARVVEWSDVQPAAAGLLRKLPQPAPICALAADTAGGMGSTVASVDEGKLGQTDAVELLESLHPGLCELWMEASPLSMEHAEVLRDVLETFGILVGKAVSGAPDSTSYTHYFDDFVRLVLPHFPFPLSSEVSAAESDDAGRLHRTTLAAELNTLVCKLFAPFLAKQPSCSADGECKCWASSLIKYAKGTLSGFVGSRISSQLAIAIAKLLPTLTELLAHSSPASRSALLDAFARFNESCAPASTARQMCVAFVADTVHSAETPMRTEAELKPWIGQFPKLLWQLKTDNLRTTDTALSVLLHCARLSAAGGVDFLQDALVPFFHVTLHKKAKTTELFGPFLSLPVALQEKAIQALHFFSCVSPAMERSLLACALETRVTQDTINAILGLLEFHHYWKHPDTPLDDFAASSAALLVHVCAALAGKAEPRVSPQSAVFAAERLCDSARRVGAGADVLASIGDVLPSVFSSKRLPANVQSSWPLLCFVLSCSQNSTAASLPQNMRGLCVSAIVSVAAQSKQRGVDDGCLVLSRDVTSTAEALCVRFPEVLFAVVDAISESIAKATTTADRSKLSAALVCIVEMPLLRTPEHLLFEPCRKTVIDAVQNQARSSHRNEELWQAVSLLYALK